MCPSNFHNFWAIRHMVDYHWWLGHTLTQMSTFPSLINLKVNNFVNLCWTIIWSTSLSFRSTPMSSTIGQAVTEREWFIRYVLQSVEINRHVNKVIMFTGNFTPSLNSTTLIAARNMTDSSNTYFRHTYDFYFYRLYFMIVKKYKRHVVNERPYGTFIQSINSDFIKRVE